MPVAGRPAARGRLGSASPAGLWDRAHTALGRGSLAVALLVGGLLAIPGPFDLLALGRLARDGDGFITGLLVMFGFAVVKFAAIELPIAAYTLDGRRTAARVARFSEWMRANRLAGIAAIIALLGLLLVARGVSALA